jgi:hypothetical protein
MNSIMHHRQLGTATARQGTGPADEPQAKPDPRTLKVCCGNSIAPRMAELRQPGGQTIFVTVWQCPVCKRVMY